jgi:hypothetical protein
MEDYYLAEERMKTADDAETVTLDELVQRYGLED